MLKNYAINWRRGASTGRPLQFAANSPKEAAVKAGKCLGFKVEEKICGEKHSYISASDKFDGAVPLSLCIFERDKPLKFRYYNITK